jgi:fluoride exporter
MSSSLAPGAWAAVALGGALGATARYATTLMLTPAAGGFPIATLAVNVLGGFLIGIGVRLLSPDADHAVRLALTTGFCGGFTTFSAFGLETVTMLQQGRAGRALLYVTLSLVLGVGATALGLAAVRPRP